MTLPPFVHPLDMSCADSAPAWGPLDSALVDARIILLGEQSHGDGSAFALKASLVRHLHLHLGFDVLVMEACFYSLDRAWRSSKSGKDARKALSKCVYPFWAQAQQMSPLWELIERRFAKERPLAVAGLDPRHAKACVHERLVPELERILREHAPSACETQDFHDFRRMLEELLDQEYTQRVNGLERMRFVDTLWNLRDHLETAPGEEARFWQQELRNLAWAARNAWALEGRDQGMGDNLLWLARDRFPKRKVLVWTHNWHAVKNSAVIAAADARYAADYEKRPDIPLGEVAASALGDDVLSLALIAGQGTYAPYTYRGDRETVETLPTPPANSMEARLLEGGADTAFVNLREAPHAHLLMSPLERDRWRELAWGQAFDGVLFQRIMEPPSGD